MIKHRLSPVLVVGHKNSGKTAYLEILAQKARGKGLQVAGFLSRGQWQDNEKPVYHLADLGNNRQYLLASETPHASRPFFYGRYYFSPRVFDIGNRILRECSVADVVVLDEFGPLERAGKGFREGFDHILNNFQGVFLLAVRPSLVPFVMKQLSEFRQDLLESDTLVKG